MKRILTLLSVVVVLALVLNVLVSTPSGVGLAKALGLVMLQAAPPVNEAVTKAGVAGAVPPGATGSQTIDWTIDYELTSTDPLENLTLNDTWSAGQTLVPGSVHTPGGTWSFNQPDSTSIDFTNALVAPGGKGAGVPIFVGLSGPVSFSGGGDGFNPALTASGKLMGINHHISNAGIWCYDIAAEAVCPGYKMFPGINTSNNPFTRAIGNKIYIAGADDPGGNTVAGNIYCWDLDTDTLCGTSPDIGAYDRLEIVNDLLYVLLSTGEVDCYDPGNALAQCAGYPKQVGTPAYGGNVGNGLLPVGDSLYILNYVGDLNCLNTSTLGFCSGWSATPIDGTYARDLLFPRLSAAGVITGVCQAGAGTAATCYDLDGTHPTEVAGVATVQNGTYDYAADNNYFGSRIWFAGYGNNLGCWDWAVNAGAGGICVGSGIDVNNGHVLDYLGLAYGVTHDNFCLYTFGDAGALFSVDPVTGESPCTQSGGEVTVDIDDFYSDTPPGTVTATWDKITLTDVDLTPGVEFNSMQVWVTDPSDATVFGPQEMIGGPGVIDISSVSSSIRALTLHIQASVADGATGINAKAWLSFASDEPVQFTYQTTITCAGATQNLTNTINTTLDPHSDTAPVSGCGNTSTPTRTATAVPNTPTRTATPDVLTPTRTATIALTSTPTKTATRTATATTAPVTITFNSNAAQDGMVLESSETSDVGGSMNNTSIALTLGDDATKKQYRTLVSFTTSSIPDTATITSVTLKLKKESSGGAGDPITIFGGFMVGIKEGTFGAAALEITDFNNTVAADGGPYGPFSPALVSGWYSLNLTPGKNFINVLTTNGGVTQMRLRFDLDDNNDAVANYLRMYSGDATTATDRPQLIITYTVP